MPTPHYHVLLVEDHAPNAVVANTLIEMLGYSYLWAANGADGFNSFCGNRFDMVLMDLQMPGQSGVETTRQIRALEKEKRLRRTPIIAMTGYIARSDMNECAEVGMDDLIPKPLHPDYFTKILRKYCTTPISSSSANRAV